MPESTKRIEPPGIISYETIGTVIDRLDETPAEVVEEFGASSFALLTTCREPEGRAIGMMEQWVTVGNEILVVFI